MCSMGVRAQVARLRIIFIRIWVIKIEVLAVTLWVIEELS